MYRLIHSLLYLISLLPLRALFLLSDLAYLLAYRIGGYRRQVVRANLAAALPQLSDGERLAIEKRFYRNFFDNFLETLKLLSAGSRFAVRHFNVDTTAMEEQFRKGQKCQFHLGHHFNWELANVSVSAQTSYTFLGVYMPLKSRVFDRLMRDLRQKGGSQLLPATRMREAMLPYRSEPYLLALIADQAPGDPQRAWWLNFLGLPTPFVRGPEKGARAANLAVFFAKVKKLRRGYYRLDYQLVTEHAASMEPGELTRAYVRYLEQAIRESPDMWLWSHRRWKIPWDPAYRAQWIDSTPLPQPVRPVHIHT